MRLKLSILLLVMGMVLLSGCQNDDNELTGAPEIPVNPISVAANAINERMAELNFQELAPLAEVVPSATRADDNSVASEFETKLSSLLMLLQDESSPTRSQTFGHRFSFQAFNTVLQLSWDLSLILGDEGESSSSWFGLNSTKKGEVDYTARDGSLYTVKGLVDKETSIQFRGFNTKIVVKKACEFFVYKDGEQVLKILTGSSDNRPVWLPILIKNAFFNGQLYYRDYDITLTYDKDSSHSRTIDLTYNRVGDKYPLLTMSAKLEDDADLWKIIRHDVNVRADFTVTAMKILSFEGVTNNVNYLVVNGVQIAKCMKEGTTKQDCEQLVESFNANLTTLMGGFRPRTTEYDAYIGPTVYFQDAKKIIGLDEGNHPKDISIGVHAGIRISRKLVDRLAAFCQPTIYVLNRGGQHHFLGQTTLLQTINFGVHYTLR